jgi:hypothetical protein
MPLVQVPSTPRRFLPQRHIGRSINALSRSTVQRAGQTFRRIGMDESVLIFEV